MSTDDIVTTFAVLSETFPACVGQPTDAYIHDIREALYAVLLDIEYDRETGTHSLTGLMDPEDEYKAAHAGAAFPIPTRVGVYDSALSILTGDDAAGKRREGEAIHTAKDTDYKTYAVVKREGRKFVLSKVEDGWVRELKDSKTFYTDVTIKDLLDHLQASCLGTHAVDITSLKIEMNSYHTQADDIFQYINMLEDGMERAARIAKKQGKKRNPIDDDDLLDMATTAHIKMEQFPRTNEEWEDLLPHEKTWAKWKGLYKAAENKARVKVSASGENSFGGPAAKANSASESKRPPSQSAGSGTGGEGGGDEEIIGAIEAGFDNLANAARADQGVASELVKSNAVLVETNKTLTLLSERLQQTVHRLERENASLKKKVGPKGSDSGGGGGGDGEKQKHCRTCKDKGFALQGPHWNKECWEHPSNASKRSAGWKSVL